MAGASNGRWLSEGGQSAAFQANCPPQSHPQLQEQSREDAWRCKWLTGWVEELLHLGIQAPEHLVFPPHLAGTMVSFSPIAEKWCVQLPSTLAGQRHNKRVSKKTHHHFMELSPSEHLLTLEDQKVCLRCCLGGRTLSEARLGWGLWSPAAEAVPQSWALPLSSCSSLNPCRACPSGMSRERGQRLPCPHLEYFHRRFVDPLAPLGESVA